ncbi:MAG: Hsp20/alpha crystallin family protein [bacterium]
MKQRPTYVERIVTVQHSRQLDYPGWSILDIKSITDPYEWVPNTTVYEDEQDIVIVVELAGMKSDQISIVVEDNRLVLRGQRSLVAKRPISAYHEIEIPTGVFQKVIRFRFRISAESVQTTMADGLLEIRVNKTGFINR